jgi:anti-anti-sigma factor
VIQASEINSKPLWKEQYVMERHLTTYTGSINQPHPLSESVRISMHMLSLTGELTLRSAHTLEVEIERLFEDGVTGITLDLRQLTSIDPIGVAVIVFRCRLCKRQGHGIRLIPGPPVVQRAFEGAGVIDELPFQVDELAARRMRVAGVAGVRPAGERERMTVRPRRDHLSR